MTTSGRRVKKRNLDEPDGNTSGSIKRKKPKTGHKLSKRKSCKAKTFRPQRVAARNARNMLSQISGTSTDEEDEDDLEYNSSDNESVLQDLNIQSEEFSRNLHNLCPSYTQKEEKSLNELEGVAKPPFSVSQSNDEKKPKLIFKLSLHDSKKQASLGDTKIKCDNQVDLLNPFSGPQGITEENRIEGSSTNLPPVRDAGPPENDGEDMEASASNKEDKIRWGEVKTRTSKRSRSGDLIPVDAFSGLNAISDVHIIKRNDINGYVAPNNKHENIFLLIQLSKIMVSSFLAEMRNNVGLELTHWRILMVIEIKCFPNLTVLSNLQRVI